MNLNVTAIRLAGLWKRGGERESDVIRELSCLNGLTAVAVGALIAIYLESDGEVKPVGNDLARFNSEIEAAVLRE